MALDKHLKYRADIDGLRAVAILLVLGFHAFPEFVPAGFIGVDVFFVISGFLISGILYKNINEKNYSYVDFYCRRINRIFPALLLVMLFVCIAGWFILLQNEYQQLGKHVAGGATFISNLILWQEVNYFDNAAETKPLLHLWSLAVEEQFYIIWPPILIILVKFKQSIPKTFFLLIGLSFFLCLWQTEKSPSAAFYNPASRFWELLCGAALAWYNFVDKKLVALQRPAIANAISIAGVVFLAIGLIYIREGTGFPGWSAALPTMGAALIIAAGNAAWINRNILSTKLFVWIGLISYPLYLWHWPLLVFPKIVVGSQLLYSHRFGLIALAIIFSILTYQFFEKKVRIHQSRRVALGLLAALALMGSVGLGIYKNDGFPGREYAELRGLNGDLGHNNFHEYVSQNYFKCTDEETQKNSDKWESFTRCAQSQPSGIIDIALLGDSHAESMFIGIADAFKDENIAFFTKGALPFLTVPDAERLIKSVARHGHIKTVLISAYWSARIGMLAQPVDFGSELDTTVTLLLNQGKKVIFIMDVPGFPFEPQKCKGSRVIYNVANDCTMELSVYEVQSTAYRSQLEGVVSRHPSIKILEVEGAFCDKKVCSMANGNDVLFRDFHHLNIIGSKLVGKYLFDNYKQYIIN